MRLVTKAAAVRPSDRTDVVNVTKLALPLVAATAPDLITLNGVGTDTAGALIVAAGDNPERLRNEAPFAHPAACPRST